MATMLGGDSGFGSSGYGGAIFDTGAGAAQKYAADAAQGARQFGYQSDLQGKQLGTQRDLAALQAATARAGFDTQRQVAGIQAEASTLPARLQMQRFGQVFPYMQQQIAANSANGGTSGPLAGAPKIDAGPVFSESQIQSQVNQGRAQNDATTAGQKRTTAQSLAGRGIGASSPLAQALNTQYDMGNLATNAGQEATTRLNAAQANRQQVLAGQQAQQQQYAGNQQYDLGQKQVAAGKYSALMAALGSLS